VSFDPALASEPFCYLTTTGRVTGKPHEIEIWFGLEGETLYMMAGNREKSDWVANLIMQPNVTIRIAATTYEATGRVVKADTEEDPVARKLLVEKYHSPTQDLANWGRTALPIAFNLDA
jgi:deazaflavin-dependent oxidoreductase (nitroreductase family)